MRAIYHPFDSITDSLIIADEAARHLQVVRIKPGEEVLVLNGRGKKAFTTVENITKNTVELKVEKVEEESFKHNIHLAIAVPKKDAFEDILKIAVEMGVQSIQPLTSEFSQYEYAPAERIQRILESALIQSNNAFMPDIFPQKKLSTFIEENKKALYFFDSRPNPNKLGVLPQDERVVLIGPEGGFSEKEAALILDRTHTFSIHLSTPIQRAPTAVASSIGYLLGQSK